jgi:hypothetical protein
VLCLQYTTQTVKVIPEASTKLLGKLKKKLAERETKDFVVKATELRNLIKVGDGVVNIFVQDENGELYTLTVDRESPHWNSALGQMFNRLGIPRDFFLGYEKADGKWSGLKGSQSKEEVFYDRLTTIGEEDPDKTYRLRAIKYKYAKASGKEPRWELRAFVSDKYNCYNHEHMIEDIENSTIKLKETDNFGNTIFINVPFLNVFELSAWNYSPTHLNLSFTAKPDVVQLNAEPQVGDVVSVVYRFVNSEVGKGYYELYLDAVQLICTNGMTGGDPIGKDKAKHIGNKTRDEWFEKTQKFINDGVDKVAEFVNDINLAGHKTIEKIGKRELTTETVEEVLQLVREKAGLKQEVYIDVLKKGFKDNVATAERNGNNTDDAHKRLWYIVGGITRSAQDSRLTPNQAEKLQSIGHEMALNPLAYQLITATN